MTKAILFQWVVLDRDVPNSSVKRGNRGVVLDHLLPSTNQREPGYTLEVLKGGKTLDVISVPISWVTLLPETWENAEYTLTDSNINALN